MLASALGEPESVGPSRLSDCRSCAERPASEVAEAGVDEGRRRSGRKSEIVHRRSMSTSRTFARVPARFVVLRCRPLVLVERGLRALRELTRRLACVRRRRREEKRVTQGGRCGKALCESERVSRFGKSVVRKNGKTGQADASQRRIRAGAKREGLARKPILRKVEAFDVVERSPSLRLPFLRRRNRKREVPSGDFLDAAQRRP